jgi:hypothetical protein
MNNINHADHGKKYPLTLLGDNNKIFNYRTSRRIRETKRNKINKLIDNKKKKTSIGEFDDLTIKLAECMLSKLNKKTVNYSKFNEFIKKKLRLRKDIMKDKQYNNYINKHKWHAFINKHRLGELSRPSRDRHEDNLLNQLKMYMEKMPK